MQIMQEYFKFSFINFTSFYIFTYQNSLTMKTISIVVCLLAFTIGIKVHAQEIDPEISSAYFEDCLFSFKEPLTQDDEFFCSCVTYHLGGFTNEDFKKLGSSNPRVKTVSLCKQMANEFGKKPLRDDDIEWFFCVIDDPINVKLTQQGVYYAVEKPGTGPTIKPGQTVSLQCEISLLSSDEVIYSTLQSGEPLTFEAGKGTMIKGLELGIQQFNKGAEGYLVLPSHLAYGSSDHGDAIPANSDLYVYILVLDVK